MILADPFQVRGFCDSVISFSLEGDFPDPDLFLFSCISYLLLGISFGKNILPKSQHIWLKLDASGRVSSLWENLFIPTPKEWHFTPTRKFTCITTELIVVHISQLLKASNEHLSTSKTKNICISIAYYG